MKKEYEITLSSGDNELSGVVKAIRTMKTAYSGQGTSLSARMGLHLIIL